jgi:myo-inositol-1(or 4)-monophosphatase
MNQLHPVLFESAERAKKVLFTARRVYTKAELAESVGIGADGTTTMRIDALVEEAILEVAHRHHVNVLSEEAGFVDAGSAYTMVLDPLDGSANAAADVPLACFSAAIAEDDKLTQALTTWLETDRHWGGRSDGTALIGGPWKTTGRTLIEGGALSLLRPHPHTRGTWWSVASRAARIRILSCSTLESALVLQGSTDAFCDAGSDTQRIVDLAAIVLLPLAGGAVIDAYERPFTFDNDLTKRWSGVVAATPELAMQLAEILRANTIGQATHEHENAPANRS